MEAEAATQKANTFAEAGVQKRTISDPRREKPKECWTTEANTGKGFYATKIEESFNTWKGIKEINPNIEGSWQRQIDNLWSRSLFAPIVAAMKWSDEV